MDNRIHIMLAHDLCHTLISPCGGNIHAIEACTFDPVGLPVAEVVNNDCFIFSLVQCMYDMGTYISASACNKDCHFSSNL